MSPIRTGLCSTPLACMFFLAGFVLLVSGRNVERLGDHFQIALPLAGLACASMEGRSMQYLGRYVLLETIVKGSKFGLGDAKINQRPNGGNKGFPSGHTAAASFGATALITTCLKSSHAAQMIAVVAAGFVGTSRVDAGKHTPWQVLAGALVGWATQILALTAFDRMFRRAMRWCGRQIRTGRRHLHLQLGKLSVIRAMISILSVLIVLSALPASADGWSVSVYTGPQSAPHSKVSGNDPAGVGTFDFTAGWRGKPLAMPPHYGVRATFWRSPTLGITADFNHTKVYADSDTLGPGGTSGGFQVLEFSDGLNNLTFGVVRRWPGHWNQLTPYAGASLGVAIPHVEVQTTPTAPRTYEYQLAGPSVAWMFGVSSSLNARWDMFAEYKGTFSQIHADLIGGGTLRTDIITNALNFGLTRNF
ncbi:phosphatase PAP2 family protein [Thalassovita sp.]|uniref:phosphatase PAP2 family protein n=1 Tax=Thalassovita sp. TaxID=1979401 RepID=UPI003B5904DE